MRLDKFVVNVSRLFASQKRERITMDMQITAVAHPGANHRFLAKESLNTPNEKAINIATHIFVYVLNLINH